MTLTLQDGRAGWRPGETLRGTAAWSLERAPGALRLELAWWTDGKGTRDESVVETIEVEPAARGETLFELELPAFPYSYQGYLVSIVWGLRLVADRDELLELVTFELGPGGRAIRGVAAPAEPAR